MRIAVMDDATPAPLVESWYQLYASVEVELLPGIPPPDRQEARAFATSIQNMKRTCWLAMDGADLIGYAILELPLMDNPHLSMLNGGVIPGRRRAGIARTLARLAVDAAVAAGRRTLLIDAVDDTPGGAFAAALGGHGAIGDTSSILRIADLDRDLVAAWIARRDERAAGYSLVRWRDRCPDEYVERYARVIEEMNTAPLGDLDLRIESSPEQVRATEDAMRRRGCRFYVVCARDDATGDLVALTEIAVPAGRPTLGDQHDTVVRPDHRNRGLGRWVKADMLRWLGETEPQIEQVVTWNATENASMRGINTELGFVPNETWTAWQFDLAALQERLAFEAAGV